MRSGRLADLTRVSTDTLRHYEHIGLLARPPRTAGNYRDYAPSCQERVKLIQRALRIGFSLAELKRILALRDHGGVPCRNVRELLRSKIVDVNRQIKDLRVLRAELNRLSKIWDKRLSSTKPGQQAKLLERVPWLDKAAVPHRLLPIGNTRGR